ncbi:carboxymuconolactone decarboxylase family protein [Photobacterium sp. CCB-ST2H9]|uniref:carboxymuconolactone decarboxylase family protein n=1 Tax=Photobacterium sp. CCB-ST2H9 TaxID=2912855 RepID=UPI002004C8B1|nr:carboxymuconolactone decarboxylase family protein [Photobacterium sp. CCB-ST2H9]UTM56766.1 carboxymuconolactone decarboxylase family protein [Photobacterium sp. CCB-ST2H9]
MTRLPYLDDSAGLSAETLAAYEHIAASRGHVSGVFALLLNSPKAAELVADLGAFLRFDSCLNPGVKELVILTALSENACQFEWGFHEKFARKAGVSPQVIEMIRNRRLPDNEPEVSQNERDLVTYVRHLLVRKRVSDALFGGIQARFSAQEITEITLTAGYYAMVASLLNIGNIQAAPGNPTLPEPDTFSAHPE